LNEQPKPDAPAAGKSDRELFERALCHNLWCAVLSAKSAGHTDIQSRLTTLLIEVKQLTGVTGPA
jgi:hypothetical protein